MAAVTSREGVIIMSSGDTHMPESSALIEAIISQDPSAGLTATLRKGNGSGPVVFAHTSDANATKWYPIDQAISTSGGLHLTSDGPTLYIYVR